MSRVEAKEQPNSWIISVGGINRFSVAKKTGQINGMSDSRINNNKYGLISEWKQWDWEGYYPFKRCLYDWQKQNEAKPKKRHRKRTVVKAVSGETWPYTSETSSTLRDKRKLNQAMGKDGITQENGNGSPSLQHTRKNEGRKQ
jgi:hypothetical protein